MANWRQEMMRHVNPQRQLKPTAPHSSHVSQSPSNKMVAQSKPKENTKKLFRTKGTESPFKTRTKNISILIKSHSEKNVILIRPSFAEDSDRTNHPNFKQKKLMLKTSKQSTKDRELLGFLPVNEISLQNMASFKALNPYLGTQKASVGIQPEKKEKYIHYDLA